MPVYIALLRGINVSGQKKIKMADLRKHLEEGGLSKVGTYIQSGNILFRSSLDKKTEVASKISGIIRDKYGFDVETIVLTQDELHNILINNPFVKIRDEDQKRLYVTYFSGSIEPAAFGAIDKEQYLPEEFVPGDNFLYFFSPDGYGNARMNNNFFEKKLGVPATTRNWKTSKKLWELSFGR